MAFIIKDRVKEGTTTTGTGAITLSGAAATFDTFQSYMTNGDTTYYAIVHTSSGVDEWEVGIGTWNTGNTLTRTTILAGSNGQSVEDLSAGSKDVFMTYPASKALFMDAAGDVALGSDLDVAGSLDVGESIEVETHIDLKTTTNNKPSHAEGRIFYDAAFGALAVYNDEADITLQVGQEEYIRVKNNTGSTISNGTPVYLTGEESSTPTIAVARADGTYNASQAVGIATHDIETNSVGYITVRGLIADVDTSHLTVGEKVHVAIGASGGTQTASPTYPNYPTEVGICLISSAAGGCIYVYTQTEALESLRVTGNSHFDANVTIDGDLTVLGNQTIASTSNVSIANAWNYFNSGDTIGSLNTSFTGTGLDDASLTGHFTGTSTTNYYIRIDSVGGGTNGVDTFEWSTDNFSTFVAQDVDITGTDQLIHSTDNIAIKFNATTGHTLGDVWTGTGSPINVDTGFASNRNTGTSGIGYTHIGIYYDVSTNKWTVFDEYSPEPDGTIDVAHSSFSYGTLKAGTFEGDLDGDVTGDLTGNSSGQHNGAVVGNVTGNVTGDVTGDVTGNADTATALETARTIQLTGDVTGSTSFDGSGNVSITASVQDDSHSHVISNVDGLQTALDGKAPTSRIITAGNGLTGGGNLAANRTISHADTSSQASVNNSSGTVIQDITLDTYGHITGINSANLDGRYYTESEADSRFVNVTGDTMTGNLTMGTNWIYMQYPSSDLLRMNAAGDRFDFYNQTQSRFTDVRARSFLRSDGSVSFHDGYHPNADKWTTSRTLSLSGDASGSVSWDGSSNATLSVTVANDSHAHKTNTIYDARADGDVTPDNLPDKSVYYTFTDDIAGSDNTWDSVISVKGWSDSYTAWQLISSSDADDGNQNLYFRRGRNATWGSLQKVWTSGNDGSGSGLDADLLDGVQGSSYLRSDTADTMTGTLTIDTGSNSTDALVIRGTGPAINIIDEGSEDDFYIHVNSNNFYVLRDKEGADIVATGWDSANPLQLEGDTDRGYLFGNRMFADNYHPNADKWTTARTLSLSGDASGSVSWDGSANATLSVTVADDSHNHTYISAGSSGPGAENLNTVADSVSTGQLSYRGFNTSSSNSPPVVDNANGVITVGQHSGNYSAQLAFSSDGNTYWRDNPSTSYGTWRKMWDAGNDGAGSGLDADLLDGVQGSSFLRSDANDTHSGTLTLDVVQVGNELRLPSGSSLTDVTLTGTSDQDTGFNWSGSGAVNYISNGVLKYNLNNVWHSGNDGSGSGLDADLLDGVQGSGYVKTTGNQAIDGIKTFTGTYLSIDNPVNTWKYVSLKTGSTTKWDIATNESDLSGALQFRVGGSSSNRSYVTTGGYFTSDRQGTLWGSSNDGAGSGLDADRLDGYHLSTTRNSANTVPVRNSSGYLDLGWINTTSGNTTSTLTDIYVNTNDGYIRKATPAHFRSQITNGYYSKISGLAYGPWYTTTGTSNGQNNVVATVADDNSWMFISVNVGTYTTGAGTSDNPTVTRYRYRKVYRTFS